MPAQILDYLSKVEWLEAQNQIPRWQEKGVRHGFEGQGHELPSFGSHVKQVHGLAIQEVTADGTQGLIGQGDIIATQLPSHRIAVKTADCVPILVLHANQVMAIHAGWRGLAQDILLAVAEFLQAKGISPKDCEWGIGPSISLQSFEIGPEVLEHFKTDLTYAYDLNWAATKGVGDRWHLDLQTLVVLRLKHLGVEPEKISVIRADTKTDEERWHSYRRNGEQAGRNWSWIEHSVPV